MFKMFKFPKLFKKKALPELSNGGIVVVENDSIRNDGYERLRDNVLYLNADGKNKVIQVESSVAHEGKTTVLCNLAVSLGLTDKKVVIVDLDFRCPRTHRVFNLSKDVGVAEYILKDLEASKIIKHTKYKNVDLVTRGQEVYNSSLVFVSEKFKSLINELREKYDYVLLDCAPVLQVSDYIHISKVSDGVLFVVAHAKTSRSQVSEAVKELKKNGANILGSVFSMYDSKRDKKYYVSSAYFEQ
jgi:capsular exopolysaccharide synthesis family protein